MPQISIEIPLIKERVTDADASFINQLKACLQNNIGKPGFGVAQLAASLILNPALLNKKIMQLTGLPASKLLLTYRMNAAKSLLGAENCSLKQVATDCGFTEQANFTRSFYNIHKCTPSAYRQSLLQQVSIQPIKWIMPLPRDYALRLQTLCIREPLLTAVLVAIIDNLHNEGFTVDMLARNVYTSLSNLFRKIKNTLDITPQHLIRDLRLQYAIELMTSNPASISFVAHHAGFFDHAHFCKSFKLVLGCAPSAYQGNKTLLLSLSYLRGKLLSQNDKQNDK